MLSIFTAGCATNNTVIQNCGEGNTCEGTPDDYICVCNAPGYVLSNTTRQAFEERK